MPFTYNPYPWLGVIFLKLDLNIRIHSDQVSNQALQDEIKLLNEKLDYLTDGNRRLHGLYVDRGKQMQDLQNKLDYYKNQNSRNRDVAKLAEKLKKDKIKLKGYLKVTRERNGVLTTENEKMKDHLKESNAKVVSLTSEIDLMKKSIEELTMKNEELDIKAEDLEGKIDQFQMKESKLVSDLENCESNDADLVISQKETRECLDELEASTKQSLQYQSENFSNLKLILEFTKNQTGLVSNLEKIRSTDADLVISQQETEECMQELEVETKKSLQYQYEKDSNLKMIIELKSNQTKLVSDLENFQSTDADLVISQRELEECTEDLDDQTKRNLQCESDKKAGEIRLQIKVKKNENCEVQNSKLVKSLEESEIKVEELDETVQEMKRNQSKLVSDLENYKSTDADLVISRQELKECTEDFDIEMKKNRQCKLEKKSCDNELQNEVKQNQNLQAQNSNLSKSVVELSTKNDESVKKAEELEEKVQKMKTKQTKLISDLDISQQKTKDCNQYLAAETKKNLQCESDRRTCANKLDDQAEINKTLQGRNSDLTKSLKESQSLSSDNQKLAQECQNELKDEVEEKETLQGKFKSVCPSWSEWSNCSKTCSGIKKRTDRCLNRNAQVEACNQNTCPYGKL